MALVLWPIYQPCELLQYCNLPINHVSASGIEIFIDHISGSSTMTYIWPCKLAIECDLPIKHLIGYSTVTYLSTMAFGFSYLATISVVLVHWCTFDHVSGASSIDHISDFSATTYLLAMLANRLHLVTVATSVPSPPWPAPVPHGLRSSPAHRNTCRMFKVEIHQGKNPHNIYTGTTTAANSNYHWLPILV